MMTTEQLKYRMQEKQKRMMKNVGAESRSYRSVSYNTEESMFCSPEETQHIMELNDITEAYQEAAQYKDGFDI